MSDSPSSEPAPESGKRKPPPPARAGAPVPVRELMREEVEEGRGPTDEAPEPGTAETGVELEVDGEEWHVTEKGRTRAGHPGDAGAPLLLLAFARPEAPESPLREALVPGRELSRLSHDQLQEAFQRSRPWSPPPPPKEDTRRGRPERRRGR